MASASLPTTACARAMRFVPDRHWEAAAQEAWVAYLAGQDPVRAINTFVARELRHEQRQRPLTDGVDLVGRPNVPPRVAIRPGAGPHSRRRASAAVGLILACLAWSGCASLPAPDHTAPTGKAIARADTRAGIIERTTQEPPTKTLATEIRQDLADADKANAAAAKELAEAIRYGQEQYNTIWNRIGRAIVRISIVWGAVLLIAGIMGGYPAVAGGAFGKIAGFVINLIPGGNISAGMARRINSGQWTKVRTTKGRKPAR